MVVGLVASRRLDTTDESVGGIFAEGQASGVDGSAEIAIHGFSNERGQRHPAPPGLVLELSVGGLGEADVRCDVPRHCGMTIPLASHAIKKKDASGRSLRPAPRLRDRVLGRADRPLMSAAWRRESPRGLPDPLSMMGASR
jgi:hypothetical protein